MHFQRNITRIQDQDDFSGVPNSGEVLSFNGQNFTTSNIIGYQGSQGFQGTYGNQGYQGYQGLIGITGPQGLQGVAGIAGNQGSQGVVGTIGSQGYQGLTGTGTQGFQGNLDIPDNLDFRIFLENPADLAIQEHLM